MIKAIFFDAFGTLCEIHNKRNPYKPIIKAWPAGVASAYQTLLTRDISIATLAHEAGLLPELIHQIEQNIQVEITSIRLYPEVSSLLDAIKKRGIRWAIVSNLAAPYAEPLLKLLPFPPDVCAWSFAMGCRKPEAAIYYHACSKLGVRPADVLMVGDSLENDYNMPKKLGMQAQYIARLGKKEGIPDCVNDLSEILAGANLTEDFQDKNTE